MSWLLPAWWKKLAAVAIVLVAITAGAWKVRHGGLVDGRAEVQAEWNADKLATSENARLREQAAQKSSERVDREYQTAKTRLLADKRITDDKLRDFQAAIKPADYVAQPTGRVDDPRDTIIDQCASALVSLDGYAKGVALTAIGLQRYTAEVCLAK